MKSSWPRILTEPCDSVILSREGATTMRASTKLLAVLLASSLAVSAQTATQPDLSKQPTLYVVGYAHLDTQWRWEYPRVINEYLPKTMHDNFALFEKYPNYIFNFSG